MPAFAVGDRVRYKGAGLPSFWHNKALETGTLGVVKEHHDKHALYPYAVTWEGFEDVDGPMREDELEIAPSPESEVDSLVKAGFTLTTATWLADSLATGRAIKFDPYDGQPIKFDGVLIGDGERKYMLKPVEES
jgi:hypothetical protein